MSEQSQQDIQFYISTQSPCPYLDDKQERKLFTHLSGHKAQMHMQLLSESGFRRSQNIIYRPQCKDCSECKSVRLRVENFKASKSQKRIIKKNADIIVEQKEAKVTKEHYNLFEKYLKSRHENGGMNDMDYDDFLDMVEHSPINTNIVEYRLVNDSGTKRQLVGVALIDIMFDGVSLVYSFFDPDFAKRSLGIYIILDNIIRTKMNKQNYVYLGYWVKNSKNMSYKVNFKPLEYYIENLGWLDLSNDDL